MNWNLTLTHNESVYRQIVNWIEAEIVRGELAPGEPLPPERKLAEALGVNRSTIRAAYDELRASGLVHSVQGSRTVVSVDAWELSLNSGLNWNSYTSGGQFLPTRGLTECIQEAKTIPGIFDLSRIEYAQDLLPIELLKPPSGPFTFDMLRYPHPKGSETLREAIRCHLAEAYGIQTTTEEILVTAGGQQTFHLITQCLLKPGDAIGMERPSYAYSLPLFLSAGLRLFPLPMDEEGVVPGVLPEMVQRHRLRMVFLNPTYQNPTTRVLSLVRRRELLQVCEELKLPIVEDDPFSPLTHVGSQKPPPALMALASRPGMVMFMGGLSKTAAPGLRTGWIVAPKNVIDRLADAKYQMDFGTSHVIQEICKEFLQNGGWAKNLIHLREALTRRRDIISETWQKDLSPHLSWTISDGGCHVWCELKEPASDRALLDACIEHGLVVTPGSVFGEPGNKFRLAFSSVEENELRQVGQRLLRAIESLHRNHAL